MPFIQRCLEPINVSRVKVEKGIKNELECVTNHTLSNIILQLSSLSKHAEDMFTEMSIEVKTFIDRTQHLQGRIDQLQEKVTRLDATAGTLVSIHELHLKKPFKSSTIYDQQVVSRSTIPRCTLKAYSQCNPTPALNKLSKYRDDGRDSLKFYTDPGYFFELWFLDIQKDMENKKIELELKSRKKKKPKPTNKGKKPRIVKTKAERYKGKEHGVEFIHYANPTEIQAAAINKQLSLRVNQRKQENIPYDQEDTRLPQCTQDVSNHTSSGNNKHEYKIENSDHQKTSMHHSQVSSQPNMAEKYSSGSINTSKSRMPPPNRNPDIVIESHYSLIGNDLPPPPPPPLSPEDDYPRRYPSKKMFARVSTILQSLPETQEDDFPLPPFPSTISPEPIRTIPPAPKAPPPPNINTKMVPTNAFDDKNSSVQTSSALLMSLKRKSTRRQSGLVGGGSNFLEQIRGGIHLRHLDDLMKRKVNENGKGIFKKSTPDGNFDVHSIMNRAFEMRRKVIEGSEEEDNSSDNEWSD